MYDDINPSVETPSPEGEGKNADVVDISNREDTSADSGSENAPQSKPDEQGKDSHGDETWQHKYQTLQGMYNAEVPRFHAQLQDLQQRNQQMEQLISTMQAAPTPTPIDTPVPASLLTEDEIDEYGESIDIMRKVSQEISGRYEQQIVNLQQQVQQLTGSVIPRVEQLASQQAQSSEQSFWASLQTEVPNWREINDNPQFQNWLLEIDPLSGLSRQTYLDDAQRNQDHRRVASFFQSWNSANGTSVAQPNRSNSNSELERQVSPGKSHSGGTTHTQEARTYTPQDITKFFTDVRMGKFKGKEEERDKLERDIFAAQAEGRIVNA